MGRKRKNPETHPKDVATSDSTAATENEVTNISSTSTQSNTEPIVQKKRGRPRKDLPTSLGSSSSKNTQPSTKPLQSESRDDENNNNNNHHPPSPSDSSPQSEDNSVNNNDNSNNDNTEQTSSKKASGGRKKSWYIKKGQPGMPQWNS